MLLNARAALISLDEELLLQVTFREADILYVWKITACPGHDILTNTGSAFAYAGPGSEGSAETFNEAIQQAKDAYAACKKYVNVKPASYGIDNAPEPVAKEEL